MMKSYHYGIHMLLSFKLGYTVPVNVVGPGILFGHMGTILINKKAKLGKNCILNCLINIGGERHGAPQIDDGVYVASGSYIYGPVKIGRHAIISGAKVHTNIPPYAIVSGNPAKIVGYKMTPEEIVEFEKDHYPENERISIEKLRKNYDKYFLNKERIAEYLSLY